jgi:hypothetical protein
LPKGLIARTATHRNQRLDLTGASPGQKCSGPEGPE